MHSTASSTQYAPIGLMHSVNNNVINAEYCVWHIFVYITDITAISSCSCFFLLPQTSRSKIKHSKTLFSISTKRC